MSGSSAGVRRVLDASAVLTLLLSEPGHPVVARFAPGALLSTVNLAEVVGKAVDRGLAPREVTRLLVAAGVELVALSSEDATLAGALRSVEGGRALSLADRACLALALREPGSEVLTADRAWADLDLPLHVRLVR